MGFVDAAARREKKTRSNELGAASRARGVHQPPPAPRIDSDLKVVPIDGRYLVPVEERRIQKDRQLLEV